jgi:hypothetical protein
MNVIHFFLLVLSLTSNSSAFLGNLFGRNSSENQCPIKLYNPQDPSFTGVKLYVNAQTFNPLLEILSDYAKRCHVKIDIKRAFIQEKSPSKTDEQLPSTFQLGEAIEYELVNKNNKVVCNRLCLGKSLSHLKHFPDAKCFLRKLSRNHDFQRDSTKPTILMKRRPSNESFSIQEDQRKILQNKCRKLDLN